MGYEPGLGESASYAAVGFLESLDNITYITGLIIDNPADALAVMDQLGITVPTLDLTKSDNYLNDVWGAVGVPTTFFIDPNGVIVAVQDGNLGDLREIIGQLGW